MRDITTELTSLGTAIEALDRAITDRRAAQETLRLRLDIEASARQVLTTAQAAVGALVADVEDEGFEALRAVVENPAAFVLTDVEDERFEALRAVVEPIPEPIPVAAETAPEAASTTTPAPVIDPPVTADAVFAAPPAFEPAPVDVAAIEAPAIEPTPEAPATEQPAPARDW